MKSYGICPASCGEFVQGILDNEEYLDFAESIYTNEFIYKIHNKKEENECTNIKDFIWKDVYSVKNILNSQKSMLFLYTIVKENKNYYCYNIKVMV